MSSIRASQRITLVLFLLGAILTGYLLWAYQRLDTGAFANSDPLHHPPFPHPDSWLQLLYGHYEAKSTPRWGAIEIEGKIPQVMQTVFTATVALLLFTLICAYPLLLMLIRKLYSRKKTGFDVVVDHQRAEEPRRHEGTKEARREIG